MKTVLLASLLVLGSSCAGLRPKVEKPTLTFDSISVQNVSFNTATFLARFEVENPNSFNLDIDRITYILKLNDQDVGIGAIKEPVELKGHKKNVVELPIRVKYKDLIAALQTLANRPEFNQFTLAGTLESGPHVLPFEEKGDLELPFLPKAGPKS